MRRRLGVRLRPVVLMIAAVIAAIGLLATRGLNGSPSGTADAGPSPTNPVVAGLAHFDGEGFGFDYPASWRFYPLNFAAMSHFTTAGYLASQPIDTSKICSSTANSTSCNFRAYDLGPGQAVVEIAHWGWPIASPLAYWDHPDTGQRLVVGGMPAIVSEEQAGPGRSVTTWKIARPDVMDNWIQLDADVLGPGDALTGAKLSALIASFRFDPPPAPLDIASAARIGNAALTQLRANDPEGYACFPPVGQSVRASVMSAPGAPLRDSLDATCSTAITATDIGFWRLQLTVAWGEDPVHTDMEYITDQWLQPNGTPASQSGGGDNLPNCCRG